MLAAMPSPRVLEVAFTVALFAGQLSLWALKRARQRAQTGRDPEVLGRATSPQQRFFARAIPGMTGGAVIMTVVQGAGIAAGPFGHFAPADRAAMDLAGLAVGTLGLALCALAQRTMGASWRVGIDEEQPAPLVDAGLYRWIRNPTYLGLFLLDAGLWLIWPTTAVAMFWLAFWLLLEMQVRCEEEFMARVHGPRWAEYASRTWRYLPWVY